MASLSSEAVIANESGDDPARFDEEVQATEKETQMESKDDEPPETKGEEEEKVEEKPAVSMEDEIPEPQLLETSCSGDFLKYTPPLDGEDDERPFDVVFVHGLNNGYGGTWTTTRQVIKEKYPKSRIITCNYISDSPIISPFTMSGLRSNAIEILTDLMDWCQRGEMAEDGVRPIVFITQDIGGTIVKLALWIASLDYGKYKNILDSTRGLIFFGCPHRASTPDHMENMVANLIYGSSPTPPVRPIHRIQSLTKAITDINGYFAITNLPSLLEIINIYSEDTDPALRIFDKFATTFGVAFEERIGYAKPHKELTLTAVADKEVEKFYPAIDRILSTYPGKPDDHSMGSMRAFTTLASRGTPIQAIPTVGKRFQWVTEHKFFTTWLTSYGTDLLYVSGKSRIAEVSDHILQSLDDTNVAKTKGKDLILTFRFEKNDIRYSSVVEMLTSLLAQVFRHRQAMTDFLVFEQMQFYRSWTQTELLILFKTVLGHNDHEGIIVVISCVDQCDDTRTIFLQDLCHWLTLTEHRIKILVTGAADEHTKSLLSDHQAIELEEQTPEALETFLLPDVKDEIEKLIQWDPFIARLQRKLREYLKPFAHDRQWLRLMTAGLRLSPGEKNLDIAIASTPESLGDAITQILDKLPTTKRGWARKAILWIVYAFRPLKTWELGTALALEFDDLSVSGNEIDDFGYSYITAELETVFQGLFIVKDHEIQLGHPEIRDFFMSTHSDNPWYDLVNTGHKEIVEASTSYFMLSQVQKAISKRYLHQPRESRKSVFPESWEDAYYPGENTYDRYSFCSYAALYWTKHYKLLPVQSRFDLVKSFVQDRKAARTWSEAHWWLSNCINRGNRSFVSDTLLPVFAGLGLKDLLVLSDEVSVKDRALALNEAARNGHLEIVRLLLQYGDYDEAALEISLVAASACENEELITELVLHAAATVKQDEIVEVEVKASSQTPIEQEEVESKGLSNTTVEAVEATVRTTLDLTVDSADEAIVKSTTESSGHEEEGKEAKEPAKKCFPFPSAVLCRAVAFSFEKLSRKLLEIGAPVQVTTIQNMTPLDFAVRQRNPAILKLLLDYKAEIGLNMTMAYHPLHLAVIYGMPEMVQQLIDAGIGLNLKNTSDSTATYLGCWHRHHKAVEPIIKAGADLNNDTKGLWTPLTACARRDTRICAKILLDNGADVEVIGFNEWTPLRSATVQGYVEFSKILLDFKADPNTTSGAKGAPIICEVARQGNLELVKLLVENGAKVTAADFNASTAVLNAGVCGKTDVVEYLFDHGANVLDEDVTGFNTVALAAYSSFPKTIEIAAAKGVDIHNESKTKWTPIHYAYDDAETTRVLMKLGADPNRIAEFYTPLILSATFNKPETAKVLLEYKPKLEITYNNPDLNPGLTALAIAVTNGHLEVAKELLEAGANVNHQSTNRSFPLEYPVRDQNLPLLKLLLEYNPDLTKFDQQGNTALHCITGSSSVDIARALVNAGAPLDAINKRGYTPLGEAIQESNLEVTKYLIKKGSPLNTVGGEVGGPLHLASRNNTMDFIAALVEAGADINSLDPCLGTPLQAACSRWAEADDLPENEMRDKILKYFIEDLGVDVHLEGGDFGCALNAICAFSTPEIIEMVLAKGAKFNIADPMGRQAIHLAASNGMQRLLAIHGAGADINAKDLCGRSVLHWATIGGNIDVIERVLSLSRDLLNSPDNDGWTPLMWACRGAGSAMNKQYALTQEAVIDLLLRRGADPTVIAHGGGGDREWSILSVARYNGGEKAGFMPKLIEETKKWVDKKKEVDEGEVKWDEKDPVHQSRVARVHSPYCDSCLMTVGGLRYRCKKCLNHDFCAKCFTSIKIIHTPGHVFDEEGPEFEQEAKKDEKDDDDESSDGRDSDGGTGEGGSKKTKKKGGDGGRKKKKEEEKKVKGGSVVEGETDDADPAVEEEGEPVVVTETGHEDSSDSSGEDTEGSD